MALRPTTVPTVNRVETLAPVLETSRTYDLFGTELRGYVDTEDAIRQYIRKALVTARSTFLIYDNQYGSEIEELIGQRVNTSLFDAEIIRLIREALIYDDRILEVDRFTIDRSGDAAFVEFTVTTVWNFVITERVTI